MQNMFYTVQGHGLVEGRKCQVQIDRVAVSDVGDLTG